MELSRWSAVVLLAVGGAASTASWAVDPNPCLGCHEAADLATNDVITITDALHDPGIPAHKPFSKTTDEGAAELLEAFKAMKAR